MGRARRRSRARCVPDAWLRGSGVDCRAMADVQPIVIQTPPAPGGYGGQILVGALAGVLAWWLIETLFSSRDSEPDDVDE